MSVGHKLFFTMCNLVPMPSGPPAQRLSRCIESIDHMIGFVDALRDSFENVANSYDQSLVSRLSLCDYLHCELESLAQHLGSIRPMVMRRKSYMEYDDDGSRPESQ